MTLLVGPKVGLLVGAAPGEGHFAEQCRLLRGIDGLLGGIQVLSRVTTLPTVFADGDMYLITSGANANRIARRSIDPQSFSGWEYFTPKSGWLIWSVADAKSYRFKGSPLAWVEETSGGGGGGYTNFEWQQTTPLTTWTVAHNLGRRPSVTVTDNAGNEVFAAVSYVDANIVQINFGLASTGFAYCN